MREQDELRCALQWGRHAAVDTICASFCIGAQEELCKADHDFSRFNLIPSVNLKIDIPENVDQSFYQGETTVTIKCAITQPSSAARHVVEAAFAIPEPSKLFYL